MFLRPFSELPVGLARDVSFTVGVQWNDILLIAPSMDVVWMAFVLVSFRRFLLASCLSPIWPLSGFMVAAFTVNVAFRFSRAWGGLRHGWYYFPAYCLSWSYVRCWFGLTFIVYLSIVVWKFARASDTLWGVERVAMAMSLLCCACLFVQYCGYNKGVGARVVQSRQLYRRLKAAFKFNGYRQWSRRPQPRQSGGDTTPRQDTRREHWRCPAQVSLVVGCLSRFRVSQPSRREYAELRRPVSGPAGYPS